eukprot:GFUD01004743.1.p1 GENE.GFUD01004743.1~~GFUD01004743.1.p1  ORF type:complete len:248 (+),score=86.68 GFUD01004743.1:268-1011(+)
MRQPTSQRMDYGLLRDEAFMILPDNLDVFSIKKEFQTLIPSKRRFEKIGTIVQLVQELERQLIIFPEKKGIHQFYIVLILVNTLQPQAIGSSLLTRVADLTKKLEPQQTQQPLRTHSAHFPKQEPPLVFSRVPTNIRDMLACDLEMCGGRDWEHFLLSLGYGREKDKVRIKQGEVDHIERQKNGDIRQIIDAVLTKFEDRCMQKKVNINMLDHLIKILKKEEIFLTPLNKLANKIKEEKKKRENNYE